MNTQAVRGPSDTHRNTGGGHLPQHANGILLSGLAAVMLSMGARADTFAKVYYSARKDQLVVTMAYRGTNPDHTFSLKWGKCGIRTQGGFEVDAEVLDNQWQDVEQSDYTKATSFSLANIPCRPAVLTLTSAPRFLYSLQIPERVKQAP
jgi:CDP-glycerol glycerophosphotransferase (TagB/SpsB family)